MNEQVKEQVKEWYFFADKDSPQHRNYYVVTT
jgi:hypothetical protein